MFKHFSKKISLKGTGLTSGGFSVQAPENEYSGGVLVAGGRARAPEHYPSTFEPNPPRYRTPKCSHRATHSGMHLAVAIYSWRRLPHAPCDPERDVVVKKQLLSNKSTSSSNFLSQKVPGYAFGKLAKTEVLLIP